MFTTIKYWIVYFINKSYVIFLSRINRSDIDINKNNKIALLLSIIITLLLFIFKINSCIPFINYHINTFIDNLLFEKIFSLYLVLFCSVVYLLYFILKKIKLGGYIRRISLKGNEIELDENTNSILSKGLDELVHFFMVTGYNIVVFEDIDRLEDSVKVFTKLKEINFIIK